MIRVLVEFGPFRIFSYGLMLTLAFALGILLAVVRGRRRGIPPDAVLDLSTLIVVAAVVGARLLYVVEHLEAYSVRWWDVFRVWEGGLTVYGGASVAVLASVVFCRRRGLAFLKVADTLAPSMALGVGITRVGCFLNGCCFGEPCGLPWAVTFPQGSFASVCLGQMAVHPAQLYASAVGFAVFGVLLWLDRKPRPTGWLFWLFVLLFAGATFWTDFTRYWEPGSRFLRLGSVALSLNQLLEAGLFLLAIVGLTSVARGRRGGGGVGGHEDP